MQIDLQLAKQLALEEACSDGDEAVITGSEECEHGWLIGWDLKSNLGGRPIRGISSIGVTRNGRVIGFMSGVPHDKRLKILKKVAGSCFLLVLSHLLSAVRERLFLGPCKGYNVSNRLHRVEEIQMGKGVYHLNDVCDEILKAESYQEWKCPKCGSLVGIRFENYKRRSGGTALGTSVYCRGCGLATEADGLGEIPKWWTEQYQ